MQTYFVNTLDFIKWVDKLLHSSTVVAPIKSRLEIIRPENAAKIDLTGFRAIEPFKAFSFKITETIARYFGEDEPLHKKNLVFLGARGCDLEAQEVLDRVNLEGEFADPFYSAGRENILLIGADCTACGSTCFCTLMRGKPYATKLFDLNLSWVENGYAVEIGTEKGNKIIAENKALFRAADALQLEKKEQNRAKVEKLLEEMNSQYKIRKDLSIIHKTNLRNKVWRELTKNCVECSACNFVCPTCTCFQLLDQKEKNGNRRDKTWDACLKAGYAKVAGGANPRGKLYERLQNRYQCKCDYSYDRLSRYACVGCGRCIDACVGNIDMRKIFVELEKQAPLTAKLE